MSSPSRLLGYAAAVLGLGLVVWVALPSAEEETNSAAVGSPQGQDEVENLPGSTTFIDPSRLERTTTLPPDSLTFEVAVKNGRGEAIVGAWVAARQVARAGHREIAWPVVPNANQFLSVGQTNEDGVAILNGVTRNGMVEVGTWGAGNALKTIALPMVNYAAEEWVELELISGRQRSVLVKLHDLSGAPVAGAEVRLRAGDPSSDLWNSQTGFWGATEHKLSANGSYQGYSQKRVTNAQGETEFHSVPAGEGYIRWFAKGFINCGNVELINQATKVTIQADPGLKIRGQVLDADGDPAIGVHVSFESKQRKPKYESTITAERDRHFYLDDNFAPSANSKFAISGLRHDSWHRPEVYFEGVWYRGPWRHGDPGVMEIHLPKLFYLTGKISPKVNGGGDNFIFFMPLEVPPNERLFHNKEIDYVLAEKDGSFRIPVDSGKYLFGFEKIVGENDDSEIIDSYSKELTISGNLDLGTLSLPAQGWRVEREDG